VINWETQGKKPASGWRSSPPPYYVFKDAGVDITVASPKGGQPPLDPKSDLPDFQTAPGDRFKSDPAAQKVLANSERLSEMSEKNFDAIFYPGGHAPCGT
jgi:putative intracellular protease/amidase